MRAFETHGEENRVAAESPQPRCDAEAVCQCRGTRRSVKISGATMLCEFYGSSSIIYWRS